MFCDDPCSIIAYIYAAPIESSVEIAGDVYAHFELNRMLTPHPFFRSFSLPFFFLHTLKIWEIPLFVNPSKVGYSVDFMYNFKGIR